MSQPPSQEPARRTAAEGAARPPEHVPAYQPAGRLPTRSERFLSLRGNVTLAEAVLLGALCVAVCLGIWWFLTRGEPEERTLSPAILPSPRETFGDFKGLVVDRKLPENTYASLKRVALGFGLAAVVGVPLGILCGCFGWMHAFFAPLTIMGRNIPVAALIPLTFSLFGIGEFQKIMFLFIACVAFVVSDTATAVQDIPGRYVDTAYTLGAGRRQIILKVLTPLAMPGVFNSLRLLFGLAFGYIMLAELVQMYGVAGGLGAIINNSQRRGIQTHILLVLMVIPVVALAIDRGLYWIQRQLFPYQYGGRGILHRGVGALLRGWEDVKSFFFRTQPAPPGLPTKTPQPPAGKDRSG